MGLDADAIVEQLIAYWNQDVAASDVEMRRTCRRILAELAPSLSAAELLVWQEDPEQHRQEIERGVAAWLAARGPSRDLPPSAVASRDLDIATVARPAPPPPPALPAPPRPAAPVASGAPAAEPRRESGTHIEQQATGSNNITVGTMNGLSGGFHIGALTTVATGSGSGGATAGSAAMPETPVRILFLGANPADSTRLRLDEEVREIDHALASAALGKRCDLRQQWAVRVSELQGFLLRTKPRVLHFSGHGSESAIMLESDGGGSRPVAAARLANLLKQFNQNLRCVVLNACYSAEQAEAIAEHIDCVIGMSAAVADRAAIRFAAAFYLAVASGCSVQAAFDQGCADIEVGELAQDEVPALIARRCDPGQLVLVDG